MEPLKMIVDGAGRAVAFEPLLDRLAEIVHPSPSPWGSRPDGHEPDWYERCETKRLAIARAAEQNLDTVRDHTGLVLDAIVHDTCPSGNRQLVRVALRALGARAVLETLLEYAESGDAAEQLGAAMAAYWAHPVVAYDPREVRAHQAEIEAENRELGDLRDRVRRACAPSLLLDKPPIE